MARRTAGAEQPSPRTMEMATERIWIWWSDAITTLMQRLLAEQTNQLRNYFAEELLGRELLGMASQEARERTAGEAGLRELIEQQGAELHELSGAVARIAALLQSSGSGGAPCSARDGVPPLPLQALPRGGLRGALDRLSPRNSPRHSPRHSHRGESHTPPGLTARGSSPLSPSRGKASKNKIRSPRPPEAPAGGGAEPGGGRRLSTRVARPAPLNMNNIRPPEGAGRPEAPTELLAPPTAVGARPRAHAGVPGNGEVQERRSSAADPAAETAPRVPSDPDGVPAPGAAGRMERASTYSEERSKNLMKFAEKEDWESAENFADVERQGGTMESLEVHLAATDATCRRASADTCDEERSKNLMRFAEKEDKTVESLEDLQKEGQLLDFVKYVWKLKEPERDGRTARLLTSTQFEVAIQVVIMANCVFMALAANSSMENWKGDPNPILLPFELLFQFIYTVELIGKLYVHRLYFFWNEDCGLNVLDFSLVFAGAVDIVLRVGYLWNLSYMRSLRILKVAKALRLVRVVTGAVQLRNMFICIMGSLMNFVWSIVMIVVVLYVFALGLVISAGIYLSELGDDTSDAAESQREDLLSMYGSVQQAMFTLYKATTGGDDWSLSFNAISNAGFIPAFVYLLFVSYMQIALVNIITGIFVDTALQKLAPDRDAIALSHHRDNEMVAKEMRELWKEVAEEKDGFLSIHDFCRGLHGKQIPYLLEDMGLRVDHVTQFFEVLHKNSVEDGKVRISNFVHGCMRLKGSASSFDIQELRSEVFAVGRKVDRVAASSSVGSGRRNGLRSPV